MWWEKEMQLMMTCAIAAGCNPSGKRAAMGANRQQWKKAAMGNGGEGHWWSRPTGHTTVGVTHQPGQRTKQANCFQVSHAQMVQVGGDPALQDEESPANDAVDPTQCHDMDYVLRATERRLVTAACNEISSKVTSKC